MSKKQIEEMVGCRILRKWVLDGAGRARWGWAAIEPCRERWLGRTLREIAAKAGK